MELEWDEAKRQWTLDNRGLDFADLAEIDRSSIRTFRDRRRDYGEVRFNSFAYLGSTLLSFCWTRRGRRIRVISMRKANERERKTYQAISG